MAAAGRRVVRTAIVAIGLACSCPPARAQAISFSTQVAPLLVAKCGGCHVAGRKGDFQMASYAGLMRSGMVQRGAGNTSRLVEVILSGDMPRGGGKVTSDEVGTLMKWIDAGAAYDAADPTAPLERLGGAAPAPPPAAAPRPVALKPGEVSFALDVAPVLLKECGGCHGQQDPQANLRLTSLEALLAGGRSGPAVGPPAKAAASLLVRKLRGREIEGQRMPLNKKPLADDVIDRIERWIAEGARLDMLAASTPLETLVAAGRARSLSNADLEKVRHEAGLRLWRRAIPDEDPTAETVGGVRLIGNLPPARMRQVAAATEPLVDRVRRELTGDGETLLHGGLVVYVFRHAYDYSALWQNVLNAERPKGIAGHAGVSGDVVYGAVLLPEDEQDARVLLAEQLTAAALAGRMVPEWFARGAGRTVAARIAPKAPVVLAWKRDVSQAVGRLGSAADFLAGHGEPAARATAAGDFVGGLATGARLRQFVEQVDAGAGFDAAFAKVFRVAPRQAFEAWATRQSRQPPRPR